MPQAKTLPPAPFLALLVGLPLVFGAPPVRGATHGEPRAAGLASLRKEISEVCGDASVVILGERHRQPRSHALFLEMVETFVARGERVVVGLEIDAQRQTELEAALGGLRPCPGVAGPPIDSDSYQELIRALGRLTALPGRRVRVLAIDAQMRGTGERDAAMASRLTEAMHRDPTDRVLVLVGNLHALKEIPWADPQRDRRAMLAGLLTEGGTKVVSFVQRFPSTCNGASEVEFQPADASDAAAAVCELWGCLRTDPLRERTAASVAINGVVSWSCGN